MKQILFFCSLCKKNTKSPVKEFELEVPIPVNEDSESSHWRFNVAQRACSEKDKLGEYATFNGNDYWMDAVSLESYWTPFWETIRDSNSFIYIEMQVDQRLTEQPNCYYAELLKTMVESRDLDECHATACYRLGDMSKYLQIREFQQKKAKRKMIGDR